MEGSTDGPMDGWMDMAGSRVACLRLTIEKTEYSDTFRK